METDLKYKGIDSNTRTGAGIFALIELIVAALRSVLDAVAAVGAVPFIAVHWRSVDSDVSRRLAIGENVRSLKRRITNGVAKIGHAKKS